MPPVPRFPRNSQLPNTRQPQKKSKIGSRLPSEPGLYLGQYIYPARNILSYVEAASLCGAFFLRARGQCALYY